MIFTTIDYQVDDGIAHIILKRPDQLNAVNSLMSKELPEMWKIFNDDNSAIVAIISGFGNKSFCVGADLADLPDMDGDAGMASLESIKWTSLQNNIWKPVICAVNGIACIHKLLRVQIYLLVDTFLLGFSLSTILGCKKFRTNCFIEVGPLFSPYY